MTEIRNELNALEGHLGELRRALHRHPELGLHEYETALLIERELDAIGVAHVRCGETGVLATIRGEKPGEGIVALRADIDALPVREENEAPYRSQVEGVMHACGHDGHTVMLLGASTVLQAHRKDFSGEVRLIFQPAEEIGEGTAPFFEAGALEGVKRCFGLHVVPDLPIGTVGIKGGLNNAGVDHFTIRLHGRSTHISMPQEGADALYAAAHLVVALQSLVTRRCSPTEAVLVGVGKLTAGTTYNAIADAAVIEGTTRTVTAETQLRLRELIEETARSVASVSGVTAEVGWSGSSTPVVNDENASAELRAAMAQLDPALTVTTGRGLVMSGDNMADFLDAVPGCYAALGVADPAVPGSDAGLHNCRFDIGDRALVIGAELHTAAALCWLGGEGLLP